MGDGRAFVVEGEFTEVAPPRKLAFTWRSGWDAPHETFVTYLLEPCEAGTHLTLRHEGFADRTAVCSAHAAGWIRVLNLLDTDLRPASPPAQYYFFKLFPPRLTFISDATAEELALMRVHAVYWRAKIAEGKVIAIGPVADPAGGWGMGLLRAADRAEADQLTSNDPVVLANRGFRIEILPMPNAIHP